MKEILLAYKKLKGNATAQIAHLVFANPQNAKPKKLKEQFFSQRSDRILNKKIILKIELKDKNIYGEKK